MTRQCLGYLHDEFDLNRSILKSLILLMKTGVVWENVEVCTSVAMIHRSHVTLSQLRGVPAI